jgi:hypothetical protein
MNLMANFIVGRTPPHTGLIQNSLDLSAAGNDIWMLVKRWIVSICWIEAGGQHFS